MRCTPRIVSSFVALTLLFLVTACGSEEAGEPDGRSSDPTSAGDLPTNDELREKDEAFGIGAELAEARAQALTDRLGEEDALDAVLLAFERGYTIEQLNDAIHDETLGEDGTVEDVEPDGDRLGVIELPGGGTADRIAPHSIHRLHRRPAGRVPTALSGWDVPLPLDQVRNQVETTFAPGSEEEGLVNALGDLTVVLRLAESGYSPDQIIEAALNEYQLGTGGFINGEPGEAGFALRICDYLEDEEGEFVLPAGGSVRARQCREAMQDFTFRDWSAIYRSTRSTSPGDTEAEDDGGSEDDEASVNGFVAESDVGWTDPDGNVLPGDQFFRIDLCPDGSVSLSGHYTGADGFGATATGSGTWEPAVGTGTVEYSLQSSEGEAVSAEVEFTIDEVGEYVILPGVDAGTTTKLSITADEPDC